MVDSSSFHGTDIIKRLTEPPVPWIDLKGERLSSGCQELPLLSAKTSRHLSVTASVINLVLYSKGVADAFEKVDRTK